MIISHKYRYIFLKTLKTAGTSIEISLSRYCGPHDIITPISPADEEIRKQFGIYPQNYEYLAPKEDDSSQTPEHHIVDVTSSISNQRIKRYRKHMSAIELRTALDADIWHNYFKFCFTRNPWDQTVSFYFWEKSGNDSIKNFDEWLTQYPRRLNWNIYSINDQVVVDYVGKYESLGKDLELVCQTVGIPFDGWLPTAKSNIRKDKRPYSQFLTPSQATFIAQQCEQEIKTMGYTFHPLS